MLTGKWTHNSHMFTEIDIATPLTKETF